MENTFLMTFIILTVLGIGILSWVIKMYKKVPQGKALVKTGAGGAKVSFSGMLVIPVLHQMEWMDISLKRIEIERSGKDGLICKDNMRADIKVAFFVRVNKTQEDVLKVAQSIGCARASDIQALRELFDAKFSEALKTVGKQFDFVDLYNSRERFKSEILQIIGTDLNGFIMDDAAIDYLEQTPLSMLIADNILDSQGIKKITEITAQQKVLANEIQRNKEKVIKQQDVEAQEAILELEKQLAETEEKQKREVASIRSRETAEAEKISQEERLKSEMARIRTEEELQVAEENKQRQIIVAAKSKERTDAVETERVDKDRLLEENEKDRIVSLARIEKDRAIEEEQKNIQEVIRERVIVEKAVVEEEEKIKDTRAIAEAQRLKEVAVTNAAQEAEEAKIKEVTQAEADREAAKLKAEQQIVEAEADQEAAAKKAEAMKILADARAVEEATIGMSEVQVMEAKADAIEKEGTAEANVIQKRAVAEAKGLEAKAAAIEKEGAAQASVIASKGLAEAQSLEAKAAADAKGIDQKAQAMKKLDGVGKEHEEYKLRLDMQKEIELAKIAIQKDIANAQAAVIAEALKAANIDIVGGESMFFDKIVEAVTQGKYIDRMVDNSKVLGDVKDTFFNGNLENFTGKLREYTRQFGVSSEDLKNLTISALIAKMMAKVDDDESRSFLGQVSEMVNSLGLGSASAEMLNRK